MSNTLRSLLIFSIFGDSLANITDQSPVEEHGVPTISLMTLFIFGGMLYGGMLKEINKKTGIPYTPMLFVSGVLFGKFSRYLSYFGEAVEVVSEINPHGILMIFLPVLIFESGFNADWHIFKKQFGQTFILAFPCVFFGSLFIMLSIKLILQYEDNYYTWAGAFMFGSILSCTDTVAVLALLKEIGAPKKFNSLIEGESLLNDGSCMVMFQISSELVKGHPITLFDIVCLFTSLTVGGTILGILFAIVSTYWIRRIFNDGILVVNITIISCYMVYFIAENVDIGIKVSGIIALVSLGLYMAAFGKTRITSQAESYVDGFWKYAVFCAETIIFILAGILVGTKVFTIASTIIVTDLYKLLGLYVCMVGARFLSIAVFMRYLPRLGYGLTWKEVYVLTYGGLRGAIGISFALIVFNDNEYNQRLREIILFDMAGNVILTLLINGISTGPLVKWLGLSSVTQVKEKTYIEFIRKLIDESHDKEEAIKSELYFNEVNWHDVDRSVGRTKLKDLIERTEKILNKPTINKPKKRKNTGIDEILEAHINAASVGDLKKLESSRDVLKSEQSETVIEMRSKFLTVLKTQFWEFLEKNNTSAEAAVILIEATNWDLDCESEQMNSWEWIKAQISQSYIKFLFMLRGYSLIGRYARNYLFNYVAYSYDIVSSYIQAHEKTRLKAEAFGAQEEVMKKVFEESISNQKHAEEFLENFLNASFPEISLEIKTKKAAFNVVQFSRSTELPKLDILNRYLKTGQLDSQQYQGLKDRIDKRAAALELHVPHWQMKPFIDCLRENDIFTGIPDDVLLKLEKTGEMPTKPFDQEENIIKEGTHTKYIYFIRRGSCQVEIHSFNGTIKFKSAVSGMVGLESIMSQKYRSTCVAEAIVIAHSLKAASLLKLFQAFSEFEQKFWIRYFSEFVFMMVEQSHPLSRLVSLPRNELNSLAEQMEFKRVEPGKVSYPHLSIILRKGLLLESIEPLKLIQANHEIELTELSSLFIDQKGILAHALEAHVASN